MLKKPTSFALLLTASSLAIFLTACGDSSSDAPKQEEAKPEATSAAVPTESAPPAETLPATPVDESVSTESVVVELKDPVATVDGEPITRAELEAALNEAVAASGMSGADIGPEQKMEGYRQILEDLIMDKLISKASADVEVSQEEVASELAKLRGQFPTEEEFSAQLEAVGQTPESLAETLSKILRQRQWVEAKLGTEAEVSETEVQTFYDENRSEFERPAEVKASHILFLVKPDDSEEVVTAQLEKAKAALGRAKKGEDFKELAQQLSEEPGAQQSGGDLGYFSQDRMVPEFSEAAFAMESGDVSAPIRTQFGWHIIKVEDKREEGLSPLEEVKEQLQAYLKADKQRRAVEELMKSLREQAQIENTLESQATGN